MASGYFYARQHNRAATVLWNETEGLNARFEELFQPIILPDLLIVNNRKWIYRIERTRDFLTRKVLLAFSHQTIYNFSSQNNGDINQRVDEGCKKKLLLVSCYSMCTHYPIKELFVPQTDIQQRIDSVTQSFANHTIGVHIRRTDNSEAIKRSPLESFIRILKKETESDPAVKFYLASDDEEVKNLLNTQFPHRIITCSDKAERDTLEGMKFAVVDLFCLTKTSKIIGSDYSSYSQIAAEIGNIPLEYAKVSD